MAMNGNNEEQGNLSGSGDRANRGFDALKADQRRAEREETAEIQERGTLTPESSKQGVTSHLSAGETEFMYRSEDGADRDERGGEKRP